MFHSPYYEDEAHVKCSLSRSDGDSNRFLTSSRGIPHTNHTHWSSELQITVLQDQFAGSAGTDSTRGPFRRPRYARYTKVACRALVVLLNHQQYSAYIGPIPGLNSAQASRSERLILPAKCEACVQHDKRAINDRSLIDTGRGTTLGYSFPKQSLLNQAGIHLYLAGDKKSPDFYWTKQAKHILCAYLHRTR